MELGREPEAFCSFLHAQPLLEEKLFGRLDFQAKDRAVRSLARDAGIGMGERRGAHPDAARERGDVPSRGGIAAEQRLDARPEFVASRRRSRDAHATLPRRDRFRGEERREEAGESAVRGEGEARTTGENLRGDRAQAVGEDRVGIFEMTITVARREKLQGALRASRDAKDHVGLVDRHSRGLEFMIGTPRRIERGEAAGSFERPSSSDALGLPSVMEIVERPIVPMRMDPSRRLEARDPFVCLEEMKHRRLFARGEASAEDHGGKLAGFDMKSTDFDIPS